MKTCGDCKHFEWAKGPTGRRLRVKAGSCNGKSAVCPFPIAFLEYDAPTFADRQIRPCYHDSQHASQCAAFEKKDCAKIGDGVYTRP